MRKLKLIWDFRGSVAAKTAQHHVVHLKEYIVTEALEAIATGTEDLSEMHSIAFLVVDESDMPLVRDRLKPHRGQVYAN